MKCWECKEEQDVLLRGMCPSCYKAHGEKEPGLVGEALNLVAEKLIEDPGRLHRTPPDYKAQRDMLREALVALVDEDDPVTLLAMRKVLEGVPNKETIAGIKAINALLATQEAS